MMSKTLQAALLLTGHVATSAVLNANGHCYAADGIFKTSVNIWQGHTGYFEIEGCGVMPELAIVEGQTYTFEQEIASNWYHPLGFAYEPDGALSGKPELERGEVPPTAGTSTCNTNNSCPSPQYKLDGQALTSDATDPADFGLDEYEGVYFSGGRDDWLSAGTPISGQPQFSVDVQIPSGFGITEFFYFCHIHIGMSQRAIVYSNATTPLVTANPVAIPYTYDFVGGIDPFDQTCGTTAAAEFLDGCPGQTFLCDNDSPLQNAAGVQACFTAIDCAMHEEMRVNVDDDPMVLFINQMIPHHRNAVNMAKILLKANPASMQKATSYGDAGEMETMMWEIINNQNAQITLMENWLRDNSEQPSRTATCDYAPPINAADSAAVGLCGVAVAFLLHAFN